MTRRPAAVDRGFRRRLGLFTAIPSGPYDTLGTNEPPTARPSQPVFEPQSPYGPAHDPTRPPQHRRGDSLRRRPPQPPGGNTLPRRPPRRRGGRRPGAAAGRPPRRPDRVRTSAVPPPQ